jgi:hypothetical protein
MATVAVRCLGPVGGQKSRRKTAAEPPFSAQVAGVFSTICATVLFAGLSFGGRSQHESGDIAALTIARRSLSIRL